MELAVGRQPALGAENDGAVVAASVAGFGEASDHVDAEAVAGIDQGRHALTAIGVLGQVAGLLLPGEDVARGGQLGEDDQLGAPLRRRLDLGHRGGAVAIQVTDAWLVLGGRDANRPAGGVGHQRGPVTKMVER